MITYTITGDNVVISPRDHAYIEKRFDKFERFLDSDMSHEIQITVGKVTAHARADSIKLEVRMKIHERDFFASAEAEEISKCADLAKNELWRDVTQSNMRRRTLFHRGARKIKSLLKRDYN